jgi:hypothetical protein
VARTSRPEIPKERKDREYGIALVCDTTTRAGSSEPEVDLLGDKSMGTILLIILVLLLIGALPTWPYSSGWGYYPTGGFGLLLLIVLLLVLFRVV